MDFLDEKGNGNCNVHDEYFCYVEQPSNCTDVEDSVEVAGKQLSVHACKLTDRKYNKFTKISIAEDLDRSKIMIFNLLFKILLIEDARCVVDIPVPGSSEDWCQNQYRVDKRCDSGCKLVGNISGRTRYISVC